MRLVLLGTGGYHPNERRHTPCLMLPEQGIVLDAGSAMFRIRDRLQTEELTIFLTHAHLDHIIGLTFLFDVLWEKPVKRVQVYGDAATLDAVQQHLFAEPLFPATPPIEMQTLPENVPLPGNGRLTHFPLEHPGGARGYRLEWPDTSLAYVTDTTASPQASYIEQIRGARLLVHECYFNDDWTEQAQLTGHSCTTPVGEAARAAGVEQLVLVHVNPLLESDEELDLEAVRRSFPNASLGTDGMELEL